MNRILTVKVVDVGNGEPQFKHPKLNYMPFRDAPQDLKRGDTVRVQYRESYMYGLWHFVTKCR